MGPKKVYSAEGAALVIVDYLPFDDNSDIDFTDSENEEEAYLPFIEPIATEQGYDPLSEESENDEIDSVTDNDESKGIIS